MFSQSPFVKVQCLDCLSLGQDGRACAALRVHCSLLAEEERALRTLLPWAGSSQRPEHCAGSHCSLGCAVLLQRQREMIYPANSRHKKIKHYPPFNDLL